MSEQRQMILGVDFDDTLFLKSFPHNYSQPNWPVIKHVKRRKAEGWYIILVTCRTAPDLVNGAVQAAEAVGITFDAVNQNHPDQIAKWGECRKIYCDEYIDDKSLSIRELEPVSTNADDLRKPVVFISGKMRGLPNNGKHSFDMAAERLRERGHTVLNPVDLPNGLPEDRYMPISIAMIDAADCVYMLCGWHDSKGARAEYSYAICQGKQIIFEFDEQERIRHGIEEETES